MVMVEYGFFILLYLATLVVPAGKNKITFIVEKDNKKEIFFLERTNEKFTTDEVFWILSSNRDSSKEKLLINPKKHEIKSPMMGMEGEPIRMTDYLKIPKNASKAKTFEPSDALLKEKHTPIILKKTGNKVQLKQEKGWLAEFKSIEISW
ncbi:MAG: hypothetical protein MUC49_16000 [Raineya sp.]|jgi:hypothetical protein|nr:hypothetical protein [Raineya sp.]